MTQLEFGIALSNTENLVCDARRAESSGFDFITCGEHVFFNGPADNSLIALAGAAGATKTIKLMSTITLVPLYPPALLAKQVATLDNVSQGRFHLGVGVGGENPKEFEACGVPVSERGARTDESLELMRRLWTEDRVTFRGRFCSVPELTLEPKPIQKPHPPIWISGRSRAAMRRCVKYGYGWLPYMYTPARVSASLEAIKHLASIEQRQTPIRSGVCVNFSIHEKRDIAVRMASEQLSADYDQDFSTLVHKYAVVGGVEDCIHQIRGYIDAGAQTIIFLSACPPQHVAENVTLLAREVLPHFR